MLESTKLRADSFVITDFTSFTFLTFFTGYTSVTTLDDFFYSSGTGILNFWLNISFGLNTRCYTIPRFLEEGLRFADLKFSS